jgi:hypothetical protein
VLHLEDLDCTKIVQEFGTFSRSLFGKVRVPLATVESATNEKAGTELPHSKTDEYLESVLLGLIGEVKGKGARLGRRPLQETEQSREKKPV